VGLADLKRRAHLPDRAKPIGHRIGTLAEPAAADLGLSTECFVGVGMIAAHAGALGALGAELAGDRLDNRVAMVAGTSTCQMALSREPRFVPGVWGPYFGAVAPGLWLNEGGQSASGALLDHLLEWTAEGRALGRRAHDVVLGRINELRAREGVAFAHDLHILPDFHGNRSPLADPKARGVISGLALDGSLDALARLYYAGAVAIALGNRRPGAPGRAWLSHRSPAPDRRPCAQSCWSSSCRCHRLYRRARRGGGRRAAGTARSRPWRPGSIPRLPRRPPPWPRRPHRGADGRHAQPLRRSLSGLSRDAGP
jgi:hypothetical protein